MATEITTTTTRTSDGRTIVVRTERKLYPNNCTNLPQDSRWRVELMPGVILAGYVDLCDAPCMEPGCCLASFFCSPCASYSIRKMYLRGDMTKYEYGLSLSVAERLSQWTARRCCQGSYPMLCECCYCANSGTTPGAREHCVDPLWLTDCYRNRLPRALSVSGGVPVPQLLRTGHAIRAPGRPSPDEHALRQLSHRRASLFLPRPRPSFAHFRPCPLQ